MNSRSLLFLCALAGIAGVGVRADAPTSETVAPSPAPIPAPLTPAQLDELLSPIALYPDPLIAIILPASTFPADLVLATRYLQGGGSADAIDSQPWDDSVKALARYPEVIKWMDANLAWTKQVGAAFAQQPADVLTSTQRLRTAARAAGTLKDSPEQKVVVERETIRIVPANPEIIYVPVYEPSWVYGYRSVNFYQPGPVIRFSSGYRTGHWLAYHCDWAHWNVIVIHRPYRVAYWREYPRWHCPPPAVAHVRHVWRAAPARTRVVVQDTPRSGSNAAPRREVVQNPSLVSDSTVARPAPSTTRPTSPGTVSRTSQVSSTNPPPANNRRSQLVQSTDSATMPRHTEISTGTTRPRNRQNTSASAANLAPAPIVMPGSPAAPAAPAPAQRIQFPGTGNSSNVPAAPRPRPAAPLAAPALSPSPRTSANSLAAPRRPSEVRSIPAPAPTRAGNIHSQAPAPSRSRLQSGDSSSFPSQTAMPEGESSGFRRRQ